MGSGRTSRRPHGAMLGMVLSAVLLASVLALSFAATSVFGLNTSVLKDHQAIADQVADTAIHQAFDLLMKGYPDYGLHNETVLVKGPEQSHAELTFDYARSLNDGVPLSINYLNQLTSMQGPHNVVIPAASMCFVATGWCGPTVRHALAIVNFPPYPYALASGANLTVTASNVASLPDPAPGASPTPESSGTVSDFSLMLPGSILANGNNLSLVNQVLVTGNAITCGTVTVDPTAKVEGSVEMYHEAGPIPHIPIAAPDGLTGALIPIGTQPDTVVAGVAASAGDLTVNGTLTLSEGLLYVNGNLNVSGQLTGYGSVIVTGKTTITGEVNLDADSDVALVSAGSVKIVGNNSGGQLNSYLSGLVYTNGDFIADNVLLHGAFVTDPPVGATVGAMQISTAPAVHDGGLTRISLDLGSFYGYWTYFGSNSFMGANPSPQIHPMGYYTASGRLRQPGEMILDGTQTVNGQPSPGDTMAFQVKLQPGPPEQIQATFPNATLPDASGHRYVVDGTDSNTYPDIKTLMTDMQWTSTGYVKQNKFHLVDLKTALMRWQKGIEWLWSTGSSTSYKFDLNNFLSPYDKGHIALWKTW